MRFRNLRPGDIFIYKTADVFQVEMIIGITDPDPLRVHVTWWMIFTTEERRYTFDTMTYTADEIVSAFCDVIRDGEQVW